MPILKLNEQYLTVEELRGREEFQHLTDEQIQGFCDFTKAYASIIVDSLLERNMFQNDESSTKRVSKIRKK
jgi:hypothetical protein